MNKRHRKHAVSPGLRKEWLRLYEEMGESASNIAGSDYYDVRTVRKQLELARQDREVREARHVVLRQALEKHYADLCTFAQKLDSKLSHEFSLISLTPEEERLHQALRQHLPRSPMWKELLKWEEMVTLYQSSLASLGRCIDEELAQALPEGPVTRESGGGHLYGFTGSLLFHLEDLARGAKGLEDMQYVTATKGDGRTEIRYGAYTWDVPDATADSTIQLHGDLKSAGTRWQEYIQLSHCIENLQGLRSGLRDELAVVILRRVVPGRCLYCPF